MAVLHKFKFILGQSGGSLKVNTFANFAGSAWVALVSMLPVPLYLHYLGAEAYGIIGVFMSLQTFLWLFDFGLSPALNRELARLSAFPDKAAEMHDLTRTLETVNWAVSALVAVVLLAASPLIAYRWVQPGDLPIETVLQCFLIMSVGTAAQFPSGFYAGGLNGLQRQTVLNLSNSVFASVRVVGSVVTIVFVSQTIQAFLIWQAVVGAAQTAANAVLLHRGLPPVSAPVRFRSFLLRQVSRFATGITGIGIVAMILTQTDKVILSRMLTLEFFGYYTLAVTIATVALGTIMTAINNAVYPKFSLLVASGDETALSDLYHYSCQLMAVLILSTASVLAFFSKEILLLWTRKEAVAENTYLLLSFIVVGTALKGLIYLPFYLQLAYGWTKLSFYVNLAAIFGLVPLMIVGVEKYGALGGAFAWFVLHLIHLIITSYLMHRRLLKGELLKWSLYSVALPMIAVLVVGAAGRWTAFHVSSTPAMIFVIGATAAASLATAAFAAPAVRRQLFFYYRRYFSGAKPILNEQPNFAGSND